MKLRVTTDLSRDELAKALASAALAHNVADDVILNLSKSLPSGFVNWETRLRELAGNEALWEDPKLQQIEDRMVKYAMGFASGWLAEIRPYIKKLLTDPGEVRYEDFLRHSDMPIEDVEEVIQPLSNVIHIAQTNVKHMRTQPHKELWADVPPPMQVKPIKAKANAQWIARQSAGSKMRKWADGMKEDVRWQVVQAIRDDLSVDELEDRLKERWSESGAHLRTIAATELSMAYNDAALVLLKGKYVVIPPIGDEKVCKECARWLEGKVFYVLEHAPDNPTKEQNEMYLWPGKSNIGRKPKDYIPCLPLHPNCRHMVVLYTGGDPYEYKIQ